MTTERITVRDDRFQRFETLKRNREKRSRQKLAFTEGVQPIEQAIKHGWQFYAMAVADGVRLSGWAENMIKDGKPDILYKTSPALMAELSDRDDPCEIIALVKMRSDGLERIKKADSGNPMYALFDRPASPGNLGTFLRSADAFGAAGAIVTGHAADFYDTACIRGSVGTVFAIPFGELSGAEEAVEWLRSLPSRPVIIGTSAKASIDISQVDLTGPAALIIGNETFGLSKAWKELCDELVTIPICGAASSLNAGSAATVCFYEISRQRRAKEQKGL